MLLRPATICLVFFTTIAVARAEDPPAQPSAEGVEFFERHIRPVLVNQCYECHSAESKNVKGGLLLDTKQGGIVGGDSGAAVVPKDTDSSLLLSAIRYEDFEMPPSEKLAPEVIARFEEWIEMGAPDPRDRTGAEREPSEIDWTAAKQFWAFQPPTRHPLPAVSRHSWPLSRIDWFILAAADEQALSPNEPADRRTLLRRVWFDTIGLPPTPAAIAAFVEDDSPDAYERVVNDLLASSHFGEHWARLWMDVMRYAEDQAHIVGDNQSLFFPNAYLYRDWLIAALNDNMPFDDFVRLQLAADFIEPVDSVHRRALGFIGLGPKYYNRGMAEVKADEWEDRVDTVSRGLLGMTVACARCHDHKFDPIETEDYYALAGVFASSRMTNEPLNAKVEKNKKGEAKNASEAIHILTDGKPTDLNVYIRGDVNSKGDLVRRRFLRVLDGDAIGSFRDGSGRRELAEAIVDRQNPLTARVFVNRIWAAYFGRPLVGTPSNFGELGERPTHPKLLDDLAVRFMESEWSMKWLHREIVMSAAYRQSSEVGQHHASDPENKWLARMNRKRMSVEQWRDSLIAVSNANGVGLGGKSMDPQDPDSTRRTIYSKVSRFELDAMLAMFDFPDPNVHSARRSETTTPLQKLFVLNSAFMTKRSADLSGSLGDLDSKSKIDLLYRKLMGRNPTVSELELGQAFVEDSESTTDEKVVWQQYAQVLLASNEMMFID